jgi:hypothetical protein
MSTVTAEVLLEAGTNLNACNENGIAPLMIHAGLAPTEGNEALYPLVMAKLLPHNGAFVDLSHLLLAKHERFSRPLLHADPGVLLQKLIQQPIEWKSLSAGVAGLHNDATLPSTWLTSASRTPA